MARRRLPHAVTHAAPKSVLLSIVLFVVVVAQSLNRAAANSINFSTLFPASAVVEDGDKRRQRVNVRALARMVAQTDPLRAILKDGFFRGQNGESGMKTRLFNTKGLLRRKMDVGVQNTLQEIPCGASDSDGTDDEAAGSSDGTCDSTMLVADVRWAFHVCVAGGEYQNVGLVVQRSSRGCIYNLQRSSYKRRTRETTMTSTVTKMKICMHETTKMTLTFSHSSQRPPLF